MNKINIETNRVIQIALCTAEEALASRIKEYSQPEFVRTRVTQFNSLLKSALTSPDILIVDVSDDSDVESFFASKARMMLASTEIIVLCTTEDSVKWKKYVLSEEIADYFSIRSLNDLSYLKIQIWRAIRDCMKKYESIEGNEDLSDGCAETVSASMSAVLEPPYNGLQALVLEDDAPSAEAITDMLTGFGFDVKTASSVVQGVRKYRDRKFDLFLVDLMMPGISGSDVVRAVRTKLKNTGAPIIVTSAFSDDDLVKECIAEGASEYIIKPITRALILPRLHAIVKKAPQKLN